MNLLNRLDSSHFLGFRFWEFSFKSLLRDYGPLFTRKILLKHPLKSLHGLASYRRIRQKLSERETIDFLNGSKKAFLNNLIEKNQRILVAAGYCQKPIKNNESPKGCPSGQFNHNCLYLSHLDLKNSKEDYPDPVCKTCDIGVLGKKTLNAGGYMHIMTSAKDIIYDIFLPSLIQKRFKNAIFLLCPYSAEAIILPLMICDIKSILVKYREGQCNDFEDFTLADKGSKRERTFVDKSALDEINHMLDYISSFNERKSSPQYTRFEMKGNVFVPKN